MRRLDAMTGLGAGLLIPAVLLLKAALVQKWFGTGCAGCMYLPVFQHDAVVLGGLLLLSLLASAAARWRPVQIGLRAALLVAILVYLIDAFLIYMFRTRLFLEDAEEFTGELHSGLTLLYAAAGKIKNGGLVTKASVVLAIVAALALAARFVLRRAEVPRALRPITLAAAGLLVALWFLPSRQSFVSAWIYENVFEVNLSKGINQSYSEPFKAQVLASFRDEPICAKGRGASPNVILVVVESLSSYHSRLFSGLNDYTPSLDRIARENTAVVNFHANGFRTTGGMIAVMTGQFPIPGVGGFRRAGGRGTSLEGFDLGETLPKVLRPFGYTSHFLTTVDLAFSDLGSWLRKVGFDDVEGNESPEFAGLPRYHFDAPPDGALYQLALKKLRASALKAPYLLVLGTTSSHLPYISPEGLPGTEENVLRYVDRQIGSLYDELGKIGFFENGLLLITGDHRAMTPVSGDEHARFGEAAAGMIPLVVVWKAAHLPSVIEEPYQQVDLVASVRSALSKESCRSHFQGDFLGPDPSPPLWVLDARGDDRDMLYARGRGGEALIKIDGDRTRVVSGTIGDQALVIAKINHDRMTRSVEAGHGGAPAAARSRM